MAPNPVTIQKLLRRTSSPVINSQARLRREATVATMAEITRTTAQPLAENTRNRTKTKASPRRILVIRRSSSRYRFFFPTLHPSGGQISRSILSHPVGKCNRFEIIRLFFYSPLHCSGKDGIIPKKCAKVCGCGERWAFPQREEKEFEYVGTPVPVGGYCPQQERNHGGL